ncbi:MAG: hypothetical protein JXB32_11360 [Deltaproteobacteria bacterium]|nr:hypothetical protein [Deltaproteobacteria bacterium]
MTESKLQREDDDEPFDPDRRELCGDGMCVGVIGPDGRCKVCGKPGSGKPLPAKPKEDASPAAEASGSGRDGWRPAAVPAGGDDDEDGEDDAGEAAAEATAKPDFERTRVPCSNDMCTGIIGRNGRCGTCGKPWSGSDG